MYFQLGKEVEEVIEAATEVEEEAKEGVEGAEGVELARWRRHLRRNQDNVPNTLSEGVFVFSKTICLKAYLGRACLPSWR